MRTLKTTWLWHSFAVLLLGLVIQGAAALGQQSNLFSPPDTGKIVAATTGTASPAAATALFDAPKIERLGHFEVVAAKGGGTTVRRLPSASTAAGKTRGQSPIKQVVNTVVIPMTRTPPVTVTTPATTTAVSASPVKAPVWGAQVDYQSANSLWVNASSQSTAVAPSVALSTSAAPFAPATATQIGAYVMTESGLKPAGCSGPLPSALQDVDLSNLNPGGCSSGSCGYTVAPAPAPVAITSGGCCGCGGCGGGCGVKSCGAKKCGHGGCGLKMCGGGGCGLKGCGCGSCCGGRMQCTSAACNNCQCDGLCGCDCCRPRFWARADALLWYMQGYAVPGLATSSPAGTAQNIAGVLGNGSTRLLSGNQDFGDNLRPGGRLRMGYWFDPCRKFGIQGDFFALGNGGETARFNGNGTDTFARPFFNTDPDVNAQDSQIFSRPGLATGSLDISTSSSVISAGPALRWNLCCCQGNDGCCNPKSRRVDLLLGYRFFRVEEEFASREVLFPTDGLFVPGTRYELTDRITTENEFHGVEFGLAHMYQRGQWRWDIASVFAVGEVQRSVQLDGSTRITVPGFQDNTLPGGFFVGPNDVGRYEDRDYAVLPQVRTNLSYCIGCNWRLGVGYDFMYLSSAFRPDAYLNTAFNGSRLARVPTIGVVGDPVATPKRDLFLHGVNVNLTYNF